MRVGGRGVPESDEDRADEGCDRRERKQTFSGCAEIACRAMRNNCLNSFRQIGAANARNTEQRRFQSIFADFKDSFGVGARLRLRTEHGFIAGILAFFHQSRADPPDQRMEPKESFHEHVNGGSQIVAPLDVAHLVRQDRFKLRVRKMSRNAGGPEENRPPDAEHARFDRCTR